MTSRVAEFVRGKQHGNRENDIRLSADTLAQRHVAAARVRFSKGNGKQSTDGTREGHKSMILAHHGNGIGPGTGEGQNHTLSYRVHAQSTTYQNGDPQVNLAGHYHVNNGGHERPGTFDPSEAGSDFDETIEMTEMNEKDRPVLESSEDRYHPGNNYENSLPTNGQNTEDVYVASSDNSDSQDNEDLHNRWLNQNQLVHHGNQYQNLMGQDNTLNDRDNSRRQTAKMYAQEGVQPLEHLQAEQSQPPPTISPEKEISGDESDSTPRNKRRRDIQSESNQDEPVQNGPAPAESHQDGEKPSIYDFIDYDEVSLKKIKYAELKNQNFEDDPRCDQNPDPKILTLHAQPLEDRLRLAASQTPEDQLNLFYTMSKADWDASGEWFASKFMDITNRLTARRLENRKISERFEKELALHEESVQKKSEELDQALSRMKQNGMSVLKK